MQETATQNTSLCWRASGGAGGGGLRSNSILEGTHTGARPMGLHPHLPPTPPQYPPRTKPPTPAPLRGRGLRGYPPKPPTQRIGQGVCVTQGGSGYPMGPNPIPGLATLEISDTVVHAFAAALQGVATAGVGTALPSPSPAAPAGRVVTLSILHLRLAYRLAGYMDIPPI